MEAYKVLYLIRDLAKSMSDIGIKMDDYKYIGLCQEYNELIAKGNKENMQEQSCRGNLYNMCLADYRKTMPDKKDIVNFINETINDPDCKPTAVLACWRAKMDVMRVPIHWERYM